jgi:hypothetical protein
MLVLDYDARDDINAVHVFCKEGVIIPPTIILIKNERRDCPLSGQYGIP